MRGFALSRAASGMVIVNGVIVNGVPGLLHSSRWFGRPCAFMRVICVRRAGGHECQCARGEIEANHSCRPGCDAPCGVTCTSRNMPASM